MSIYFFIYFFFSIQALKLEKYFSKISIILLLIFLTIFIGLRYEIGVDWDQYIRIVEGYQYLQLKSIFLSPEIGYSFFSWIGSRFNNNIYIVNTLSAFLFTSTLLAYCNKQKYPWFSLVISFPILIIVIAMGYTRQSCAIGLELLSLISAQEGKYNKSIIYILLASTFHTSILPLIIVFLPLNYKKLLKIKFLIPFVILMIIGLYMFNSFFYNTFLNYLDNYIYNTYSSKGTAYRLFPSVVASILLLINKNRFNYLYGKQNEIYFKIAILVIIITPIIIIFPENSTFVDRFALFLIPISIYVFPRLIEINYLKLSRLSLISFAIIFYQIYTFIWLTFAIHAYAWVPYKNILFFNSSYS